MLLLLLPISVLGFRILTPNISTNKSQKRIYMVLCFLSVLFFVGLRSINTGSIDTQTYCRMFDTASSTSGFIDFLTIREISIEEYLYKEGNFYLLVWLISRFTDNEQIFLVVIAAIMTACVFKFISEHSEDFMLSCIIYICLGSMTFSMNGMRQALAMSICLLAYDFAVKKKIVPFLLIVLLAMTFHVSAFIFLLAYPLSNFSKLHLVPLLIGGGLFIALSSSLASIYDSLVEKDYAVRDSIEGGGFVTVAIYLLVLILTMLFYKNLATENGIEPLFALCFVGLVIFSTRYFSTQIFERISYYFYYSVILLIPKLSHIFKEKDRLIYSLIVCILAIALFAYRIESSSMANYQLFFMGGQL